MTCQVLALDFKKMCYYGLVFKDEQKYKKCWYLGVW